MGFIKYIALTFVGLVIVTGLASFVHENVEIRDIRNFDVEEFKSTGYNDEELSLFCDIAFMHEDTRIRKWDRDIKVEIRNIGELDRKYIAEVDSIIALLAPLIAPLKMERVTKNGNLYVYRNIEQLGTSGPNRKCLNGLSRINKKTEGSWNINFACIYDAQEANSQTLIHEFQHALGLAHPLRLYPYYITIGRSVIPQYFRSMDEVRAYMTQPFYLSEQEKRVIRMLYSPEIKAGLHIESFARRMEFDEDERFSLIPDISKRKNFVIYPSY